MWMWVCVSFLCRYRFLLYFCGSDRVSVVSQEEKAINKVEVWAGANKSCISLCKIRQSRTLRWSRSASEKCSRRVSRQQRRHLHFHTFLHLGQNPESVSWKFTHCYLVTTSKTAAAAGRTHSLCIRSQRQMEIRFEKQFCNRHQASEGCLFLW